MAACSSHGFDRAVDFPAGGRLPGSIGKRWHTFGLLIKPFLKRNPEIGLTPFDKALFVPVGGAKLKPSRIHNFQRTAGL